MALERTSRAVRFAPGVRFAQWIVCAHMALHATLALSQAPGDTADFVHSMAGGETLYGVAERYTGKSGDWLQLQRYNRIADPHRMAPGTAVRIPMALLAPLPALAQATHVSGDVRQAQPGESASQPLQAGTPLPQGTRIDVGADGFVQLLMSDGSKVSIAAGSRVRLIGVQLKGAARTLHTFIQLEAGRVDTAVQPLKNRSGRFEIHTPLAVASVRGTEFGVAIQPDTSVTSEVTEGVVDLHGRLRDGAANGPQSQALHAGQGAHVSRTGLVGPVRSIPEAPDLAGLPDTVSDTAFVRLPLPAAPGVAAYRIRISRDAAMEQVVRNSLASGAEVQFPGLEDGNYRVGARALDDVGLSSRESTRVLRVKATPVAPLFQRPAPGERIAGGAVELVCAHPAGVQRFRLQIASDERFLAPVVDEPALVECRHVATLPPGRYFWRVASVRLAQDGTPDQGPFSGHRRFELAAPPPAAPEVAVSSSEESLQIHWRGVAGHRYRVQVARDAAFADLVHDEMQVDAFLRLPRPAPGTYHVRILAISADGEAGAFSPAQTVRIEAALRSGHGGAVRDASGTSVGLQ